MIYPEIESNDQVQHLTKYLEPIIDYFCDGKDMIWDKHCHPRKHGDDGQSITITQIQLEIRKKTYINSE